MLTPSQSRLQNSRRRVWTDERKQRVGTMGVVGEKDGEGRRERAKESVFARDEGWEGWRTG